MKDIKWIIVENPPPTCGARRGPRSHTYCELPPDHIVGRMYKPEELPYHTGRSRTGKWFSWPR
jgi:hypothetical protein